MGALRFVSVCSRVCVSLCHSSVSERVRVRVCVCVKAYVCACACACACAFAPLPGRRSEGADDLGLWLPFGLDAQDGVDLTLHALHGGAEL